MNPVQFLEQQKTKAFNEALKRLRERAPAVYHDVMQQLDEARRSMRGGALGAPESWSDLGLSILDTALTVKASEKYSEADREAAELELKKLREQNAAVEKQLQLQKQIEQVKQEGLTSRERMQLAKESVKGSLLDKPWAVPALIGLSLALYRSMSSRRRRA